MLTVAIIAYILGAIFSWLIPYLIKIIDQEMTFDWRFLIGRAVTTAVALVPIFASSEFIEMLKGIGNGYTFTTFFAALMMGWGASEIGRTGQKAWDAYRK